MPYHMRCAVCGDEFVVADVHVARAEVCGPRCLREYRTPWYTRFLDMMEEKYGFERSKHAKEIGRRVAHLRD